jgi:LEA14-like dessication related protein
MLYNLEFERTKYKDLTILLDFYRVTADNAEIRIDNKDDKPIKVQGIEVEYLVDELVFGEKKWNNHTK